ncbi:hypothetical protein B9Z55_027649 [Caenorhabditis nigoni]|uniref:Uncharacterized protein n=1 Tax=Caenorhabditis nigoni TaxID=1611254 RepID=A0A2G5SF46_9PELO|nr:hypothetical protein B9Z55_027649 [Caenorhabditis nigoni]
MQRTEIDEKMVHQNYHSKYNLKIGPEYVQSIIMANIAFDREDMTASKKKRETFTGGSSYVDVSIQKIYSTATMTQKIGRIM